MPRQKTFSDQSNAVHDSAAVHRVSFLVVKELCLLDKRPGSQHHRCQLTWTLCARFATWWRGAKFTCCAAGLAVLFLVG